MEVTIKRFGNLINKIDDSKLEKWLRSNVAIKKAAKDPITGSIKKNKDGDVVYEFESIPANYSREKALDIAIIRGYSFE